MNMFANDQGVPTPGPTQAGPRRNMFADDAPAATVMQPAPQEAQYAPARQQARAYLDQHPEAQEGYAKSLLRKMATGAGMGWGDELAAAARAGVGSVQDLVRGSGPGYGQRYELEKAMQQELAQRATDATGWAGTGAEVLGGIAGGLVGGEALGAARGAQAVANTGRAVATTAPNALTVAAPAARTALGEAVRTGAAVGAVQGAGDGEGGFGSRVDGALHGAAYGAVGGAVAHKLAPVVSAAADHMSFQPRVAQSMSTQDLKAMAQEHFDRFKNSGALYTQDGLDNLRGSLSTYLHDEGYAHELAPKVSAVLNHLDNLRTPIPGGLNQTATPQGMQNLRRMAENVRSSIDPSEGRMGGGMVRQIDDFLTNAQHGADVIGANPDVAQELRAGNTAWRQYSKARDIDNALEKARLTAGSTGSGGNENNASRAAIRNLYVKEGGHAGSAAFTPEEHQAFRTAIEGDRLGNLMRWIGKGSPEGNGLMQTLNLGTAMATGGMSLPVTAALAGAKRLGDHMTRRNVEELSRVVRAGGVRNIAPPQAPNAAQRGTREFARRLQGPFGVLFASQLSPAPVGGKR